MLRATEQEPLTTSRGTLVGQRLGADLLADEAGAMPCGDQRGSEAGAGRSEDGPLLGTLPDQSTDFGSGIIVDCVEEDDWH